MLILINMTTVFMISAKAKQEMQRTIQEAQETLVIIIGNTTEALEKQMLQTTKEVQGRQDGALMIREIAVLEIQEMATA